jgi:NAD(P)-dependent dehydrogenase (short-subunit alcohol dehydrogenase family)
MGNQLRNAVVTGAYGAIGQAIAAGIASAGYRVVLVGRDMERLEKTCLALIRRTGNEAIFTETVDLGLQGSILDFSRRWSGPLHLLVNNAATGPRRRTETAEGIEVQWAVNALGYFWMIRDLHPFMKGLDDARIVNVASYWAEGMDLSDVEFRRRPYNNDAAYRQSKQADRMLSKAFSGLYAGEGITVNSCHPGDVNSKLSNFFGFGGSETPEEGAATPLYLALSPEMKGVSGKYYEHLRNSECPFSADPSGVQALYDLCGGYTRL